MADAPAPQAASVRPEIRVFLEEIKNRPEDDTPRLVLADWLQEYGSPEEAARGELLRIEVLLGQMLDSDPRKQVLRRRRGDLLRQHLDLWLGPLIQHFTWSFDRGFLHLETRAVTLLKQEVEALAVPEVCLWLESLKVREVENGAAHRLAGSPFLPYAHTLDLGDNRLGPAGVAALVRSPAVAHLKTLLLGDNRLGPRGAEALAASPHLAGLTALDLRGNRLGDEGAAHLARAPLLGNLVRLRLGGNRISERGQADLRARFGPRVSFS
jgi:uncharacterized protein (TIGR02996 family)